MKAYVYVVAQQEAALQCHTTVGSLREWVRVDDVGGQALVSGLDREFLQMMGLTWT